jgi:thiamine pyrophosphokinase
LGKKQNGDLIIAADGGYNHLKKFNVTPDIVIGDFDSLGYIPDDISVIKLPAEKDVTDMYAATEIGLDRGFEEFQIYGACGGRLDHTIGNASLLMEYSRMFDLDARGIYIEAVTDNGSAFAVNDTTEFDCGIGRQVSIFSPDNSLKIRSTGLEYPTDEVVFDNWWKATLNNAVQDTVKLEFNHPSMALVFLN